MTDRAGVRLSRAYLDAVSVKVSLSDTTEPAADADAYAQAQNSTGASDEQNAQRPKRKSALRVKYEDLSYVLCEVQKHFPYIDKVTVLDVKEQLQLQDSYSRDQLLQAVTDEMAQVQFNKLYHEEHTPPDINIIMNTAGQILVAAALVMTLTFVAFISAPGGSMPQGYKIPGAVFNETSSSLVYTSTPTISVLAFWYLDSLAYFSAAYTAATCLLVIIKLAPTGAAGHSRAGVRLASCTLYFSGLCTLGAFSAAAVSVLPDVHAKALLSISWISGFLAVPMLGIVFVRAKHKVMTDIFEGSSSLKGALRVWLEPWR